MCVWVVLIAYFIKELDLVTGGEQRSSDTVKWGISPTLPA
jgi:hypothetical protein